MSGVSSLWRAAAVGGAAATLAACASVGPVASIPAPPSGGKIGKPYAVNGRWYTPREQTDYDETGIASWYGDAFHMRATANGEIFDMNAVTAAHTTLPLPSMVEVTNLDNGRRLQVRVNDRGPFVGDRIIDLSREAARELGYADKGLARVRVRYVGPAPLLGRDAGGRVARAQPAPASQAYADARPRRRPTYATRVPGVEEASFTAAPAPITTARLDVAPSMPTIAAEPLPEAASPDVLPASPAKSPVVAQTAPVSAPAPAGAYRIQAGAFSLAANAERAASQLAEVGKAMIEPMQRGDATLYRVMLVGPQDELQAFALRERVAAAGFHDALVLQPF